MEKSHLGFILIIDISLDYLHLAVLSLGPSGVSMHKVRLRFHPRLHFSLGNTGPGASQLEPIHGRPALPYPFG